uniref:U92-Liphistoxin-Lsp1c_1 n=1 Tax=Liphistius sp. SGP-2016 TaxID=1905180 RepID=A0A4Q8K6U7_9ARAC
MLWMSLFSSLCSLSLGQAFRPQCPPLTPSFPNSCVEFRCYDRQRDDYNRDTYCEQDGVRCRANTRIQQGNYVNCAYFYSERDLEVEVRKKKSQDQISFQISNSSLRYLPREAFSGIQIQVQPNRNPPKRYLREHAGSWERASQRKQNYNSG